MPRNRGEWRREPGAQGGCDERGPAAIRKARATYAPTETRQYLAAPKPFLALVGWHLGCVGAVVMHKSTGLRGTAAKEAGH